jgi:iron complex transport system substrate-binding protein
VRVLALALLLVLVPSAGAAESVADMVGRRVPVPARPARVVSLAPSLTEIAYAVGAGDRLVGVTEHCDFPPEASRKPRVGGIYTLNLEAILSLKPDLILATTEANRDEHIRALERLGLAVYVVHTVDVPSVLDSIGRVGRLLGEAPEAERVVARLRRETETVARAVVGAPRPRVLYVVWGSPLIVPGRDTLITDLIRRAGGESVSGQERSEFPRFSVEEALARQPERIVLASHGHGTVEDHLRLWPQIRLFPAAREGRVGVVDGDLTHRSGPRVAEALRALARLIHPEVGW